MKKLIYLLLSIPVFALGQSTDQNWVKVKTYKHPTLNPLSSPSLTEVTTQVNYYDGLGRPIQQVVHGQSNTGKDIITHIEYDAFGRQTKEFLPYVNQSASLNYNSSANNDILNFYNSSNYENTANPFSEKLLEASPDSRLLKQAAPGNPWALGSGKEIKMDYTTNEEDEVIYYKVSTSWNSGLSLYDIALDNSNGATKYEKHELYKTITYDENSPGGTSNIGRTEEFKDKEGRVILKRTFNNSEPHETYYVYDVYGNLTYVIPPAVSGTVDQTKLDNMCYQYKYDHRNRLVEKKLPGKQWEYIVYDKLDRVVATGPAYSPWGGGDSAKGWMLTKYDYLNRPIYTGWYSATSANSSTNRKSLQDIFNLNPELNESKYDLGLTIDNVQVKYTNKINPMDFKLLTVTYYDDYNYPNPPSIPTQIEDQDVLTSNLRGLVTGTWVRILDNSENTTNETSYTLYDKKYRPIRVYTKNYLGGYTQVNSKLDWAGKTLYTVTEHKRTASGLGVIVKDIFEYTEQDRLLKHTQEINSSTVQLISSNNYDELGQLVSKKVGGEDITASTSLQKVDYKYNIRGWLKEINDVTNLAPSANEEDLFAFKINYNQLEQGSTGQALFNGNIAETLWRSNADNIKRKYEYSYDNLNRMLTANYKKPDVPTSMNNYFEHVNYDKNGNITDIMRTGNVDPDSGNVLNYIDELHYTYDTNNKNLLLKVDDPSQSPQGFKDNYNSSGDDYTYDANGNMKSDNNKEIQSIVYNHLNLPTEIRFSGTTNGTIYYLYNAVGQKINKLVEDEFQNETLTDYLSGFHYENSVLQFFPHAEGYVKVTGNVGRNGQIQFYFFNYVFNYTDHLGNIRLSYAQDPSNINVLKILEENHYYPFGLKHKNYNVDQLNFEEFPETGVEIVPIENPMYKYKFQGQERQDDLGLNWESFKWRNYNAAIGRFMTIDPLSEQYAYQSHYNFSENRVIDWRELEGLEGTPTQQWNGAFRQMGQSILQTLDNIGAQINTAFTVSREIAPKTTVQNTTGLSSGTNFYNWAMNSYYSGGTSTTMPFTFQITNETKVVNELDVKGQIGAVTVGGSVSNEVNPVTGEVNLDTNASVGIAGVSVYGSSSSNTAGTTFRGGVKAEASTPKIANTTLKVSGSFSVGQKPNVKTPERKPEVKKNNSSSSTGSSFINSVKVEAIKMLVQILF